ncbi:MAG TPA: SRPBCC domain-containing protein [Bryobacteraceae bacterium]|nr:SRPBCC domain-containing protein [Bryobacteraceae bacterium]
MLLNVSEKFELAAPQAHAWRLMRDTQRLAALVPGVDSVARIEDPEREAYQAQVTEKVGPFKVSMKLEVAVTEAIEPSAISAIVKGGDVGGKSRATGPIRMELTQNSAGTVMALDVQVEILGKLATLGAPVIRRRVAELFKEFGRRVVVEFQAVES